MGKIIPFAPRGKDGPAETVFQVKAKPNRFIRECHHQRLVISEQNRAVYCGECDEELDAIDVLLEYAEKQRKTFRDTARWEAAKAEFERIWYGLSLTQKERRMIGKAMDQVRLNGLGEP